MAAVSAHAAAAPPRRAPNVILIMSDDQGSVDLGCYGTEDLVTPHLDALAGRGVRFTQFYSAAPVCSASRAGTLTGRHPVRAGISGNAPSQQGENGGLTPGVLTMADHLRAGGYATGHVGKWHLGYNDATRPTARGFDSSFGHMGGCIDNWSHFFYWAGPNVHDLHRDGAEIHQPGRFFADLMVEEATRFIDNHRARPFFLFLPFNLPHYPYQPDLKWLDHFRALPIPRRFYAAFLATMDERIGAVLHNVEELGLAEDTIVIFQPDHGHSTEERAFFGGGNAGPYRGAKFSLFEGGIRLPAIISQPGRLPHGAVRGQVVHGCDWLPTVLDLCGLPPAGDDIDGRSITRVLAAADAPSPHEVLHWQMGDGPAAQWAVREGDWKLIGHAWDTSVDDRGHERIPLFLGNVAQDPGERHDFAAEQPEVVARLRAHRAQWLAHG